MKYNFLALFIIVLASNAYCMNEPREFIISYLSTVKNKTISINKECFGPSFDKNIHSLFEYFAKENYPMIAYTFQRIVLDIMRSCPIKDFKNIYDTIKDKIEDGSILVNINEKITKAAEIFVKEIKSASTTPTSLGKSLGEITLIFLDGVPIKDEDTVISNEVINLYIEGFITGLQREHSQCLCLNDYEDNKIILVSSIKTFIDDLKQGRNFIEALKKMITSLKSMKNYKEDCRIEALCNLLKSLLTKEGIKEIITRVIELKSAIIAQMKIIQEKIKEKDYYGIGLSEGFLLQLIFDFYVL